MNDIIVFSGRPDNNDMLPQELAAYELLDNLGVQYSGIKHEAAATMEDCKKADDALGVMMCKNLFLCNRQKTSFYLLLMPGDKEFHTKDITKQLNCSRLSFAGEEFMKSLLGVTPGSVTVLGLMNDTENKVQLVIDEDVLKNEYFGCHPCINTSSIKFLTADLKEKILPYIKHDFITVTL